MSDGRRLEDDEGPITTSVRPTPNDSQASDAQRRAELWAAARRQERLLATSIVFGVILGTLYFAAANAYLIFAAQPAPVQLSFERPPVTAGTYGARVTWRPLDDVGRPTRPGLSLGGVRVPQEGSQGETGPVVSLDEVRELLIDVENDTTPGRHHGELVLTRVGEGASAPQVLSAPVVVGVTAGFWRSWFLVRDWLILALALMTLCYLLSLAIFPRPSGTLTVARVGAERTDTARITLDRRPLAALMPWLRSTVPLELLGRQVAMPELARIPGRLEFQFAGVPLLVVEDTIGQWSLGRAAGAAGRADGLADDDFSQSAPIAIMHEDVFRFSRAGDGTEVRIQYSTAGRAS